jgi:hypothetical protein
MNSSCEPHELTIEAILADQLVRLAMRRDRISDEEMREVILRARTAVLRRQAEGSA